MDQIYIYIGIRIAVICVILLLFLLFRKKPSTEKSKFSLADRLQKTHDRFFGKLELILKNFSSDNEKVLGAIEEVLFTADLGVPTAEKLIGSLKESLSKKELGDGEAVKRILKEKIKEILISVDKSVGESSVKPHVVLVVGVNGTGKTTTISKIASRYLSDNKTVLLTAGDTFRAAAIEQLQEWGKRLNVEVVAKEIGSDPGAVVYEAMENAKSNDVDVVIIDTAGRLHTKTNLMEELKKIDRVMKKVIPDAPHETILVLDATTGQNAFQQVKIFSEALPITGLIMTKLDGTAKGGVLIGLADQYKIPIKFIGVGEGMDDLRPFDANSFTDAIFS